MICGRKQNDNNDNNNDNNNNDNNDNDNNNDDNNNDDNNKDNNYKTHNESNDEIYNCFLNDRLLKRNDRANNYNIHCLIITYLPIDTILKIR